MKTGLSLSDQDWGRKVINVILPAVDETMKDMLARRVDEVLLPLTANCDEENIRQAKDNYYRAVMGLGQSLSQMAQAQKYVKACATRLRNLGVTPDPALPETVEVPGGLDNPA